MLIIDGIITTSGLVETTSKVINSSIGVTIVENMLRIWNRLEMSIRGEVITTSGFAEAILEVLGTPIGFAVVKKIGGIWNLVEMSIRGRSYNYFRFGGNHSRGPKQSRWNGQSR